MLMRKFGLPDHLMGRVGGAVFAYLFSRIDQERLVEIIREEAPESEEKILEACRKSGYLLINCKLYAWAFWKSRDGSHPKPKPQDYEIRPVDVAFLSRINLAHIPSTYPAYTLSDYTALVADATTSPKIREYIGKFISKRMTFLIRNYGVKRSDLEHDMMLRACRAIHMGYPLYESELHLRNTAKTAIHNEGESKVSYYTAPTRQKLQQNTEGEYVSVEVSTEELAEVESQTSYLEHIKDRLEGLVRVSERLTPKVQRFLMACAGQYDQGFSEFLETNNAEAVEEMAYSRYLGRARTYFGYTPKDVQRLFSSLRTQLE
jgi:hypothetical protein